MTPCSTLDSGAWDSQRAVRIPCTAVQCRTWGHLSYISIIRAHVEDGLAHSTSHLHGGHKKVWYVVNSNDRKRFETFLAHQIFDLKFVNDSYSAANLLKFKSTTIHPGRLVDHQISVKRIVQPKRKGRSSSSKAAAITVATTPVTMWHCTRS